MIRISNKAIINGVAGTIYEMHPYHGSIEVSNIISQLSDYLDSLTDCCGHKNGTFKIFQFNDWETFDCWISDFLFSLEDYKLLNVSKKLREQGVTEDDGITFTSRYDEDKLDSRYSDFIDLDACIRNICNQIQRTEEYNEDCFLCKYAKEYGSTECSESEKCNFCLLNPKFKFNHETHPIALKPRKDWTEDEKKQYKLD